MRPSLDVGRADDPAEVEADRVADAVVARWSGTATGPTAPPSSDRLRRVAIPGLVHGPEVGAAGGALSPGLQDEIASARGGGGPLPLPVRRDMETALGADFSAVRVHTGPRAEFLNAAVSAKAFTVGSDIFFRDGMPDVGSPADVHLLAHELTHVTQHGSSARRACTIRRTGEQLKKIYAGVSRIRKAKPQLDQYAEISDFLADPDAVRTAYTHSLNVRAAPSAPESGQDPERRPRPIFINGVPSDFFLAVVNRGQAFDDLVATNPDYQPPAEFTLDKAFWRHGRDTHAKQWQAIAAGLKTGPSDLDELYTLSGNQIWIQTFGRTTTRYMWDYLVDNVPGMTQDERSYTPSLFGTPERANIEFLKLEEQARPSDPSAAAAGQDPAEATFRAGEVAIGAERLRLNQIWHDFAGKSAQRTWECFDRVPVGDYLFTGFDNPLADKPGIWQPSVVYPRTTAEKDLP